MSSPAQEDRQDQVQGPAGHPAPLTAPRPQDIPDPSPSSPPNPQQLLGEPGDTQWTTAAKGATGLPSPVPPATIPRREGREALGPAGTPGE